MEKLDSQDIIFQKGYFPDLGRQNSANFKGFTGDFCITRTALDETKFVNKLLLNGIFTDLYLKFMCFKR